MSMIEFATTMVPLGLALAFASTFIRRKGLNFHVLVVVILTGPVVFHGIPEPLPAGVEAAVRGLLAGLNLSLWFHVTDVYFPDKNRFWLAFVVYLVVSWAWQYLPSMFAIFG